MNFWDIFWWMVALAYVGFLHAFALAGILLLLYADPDRQRKKNRQ